MNKVDRLKFKNKNGTLTNYALYCGYIEHFIIGDNRISLSREPNDFHIKGMIEGKRIWDIKEHKAKAYETYRKYIKQIKGLQ